MTINRNIVSFGDNESILGLVVMVRHFVIILKTLNFVFHNALRII